MTKEHAAQAQQRCQTARRLDFQDWEGLPDAIREMALVDLPAALSARQALIEAVQPIVRATGLNGLVAAKEAISMLLESMGEIE